MWVQNKHFQTTNQIAHHLFICFSKHFQSFWPSLSLRLHDSVHFHHYLYTLLWLCHPGSIILKSPPFLHNSHAPVTRGVCTEVRTKFITFAIICMRISCLSQYKILGVDKYTFQFDTWYWWFMMTVSILLLK